MYIEKNVLKKGINKYVAANGSKYELWAVTVRCGQDLSVTIGNICAHVGAVVMGCPRPLKNGKKQKASISSLCALEHYDDYMARIAAEILATDLEASVGVAAGVHLDNATKDEIEYLLKLCEEMCRFIVNDLKGESLS